MWLVLTIGLCNLALGYAAAMTLVEPPFWSGWRLPKRRRRAAASAEETAAPAKPLETSPAPLPASVPAVKKQPAAPTTAVAGLDELPGDWLQKLAEQGIVAHSFVEGAAHVLRLEVGQYRESLVAAEIHCRSLVAAGDADGLALVLQDLRFTNREWLEKQTTAASLLAQRAGRLGDHEQAAAALEQTLLDQADQIRATLAELDAVQPRAELEAGGKRLLEYIASLLATAHALRDRLLELLAALLSATPAWEAAAPAVQRDHVTGLPNRIGLEALLQAWWRDDPQRERQLSVVQIAIDRLGRINQRLGTRTGDRAIIAMGQLIEELVRRERGFDRLVRLGGEAFLAVMGDTGPHQALTAAERLRQSIEAATFDDQGNEFELTLSCGVIEVRHEETVAALVRRSADAMTFAKKAGRNRCAIDEGQGPTTLAPPQFPVKGRVVPLGEL